MTETTRLRGRNYINERGREVYYRTANPVALKQKRGQFGCGREGWTCCACARPEPDCLCPPANLETNKEAV